MPNTISVVAKKSYDNGETWSETSIMVAEGSDATGETYGDAAIVMDRETGNLLCVFAGDNGLWYSTSYDKINVYTSLSEDNGDTWSTPKLISSQIYQSGWYGAFAASGRALQLRDGRIMFVVAARPTSTWGGALYSYACYSDDFGETWTVSSDAACTWADEAKVVELENGNIIMSIRNRDQGYRLMAISEDRGATWTDASANSDLKDPACNGEVIRYSWEKDGKTRLLHTLPYSSTTREDVSIYVSYDEGDSWGNRKLLTDGYSAYSSITILPDGSIGALVEEGKWDSGLEGDDGFTLVFKRFTLDWITDGEDEGDIRMVILDAPDEEKGAMIITDEDGDRVYSGDFFSIGTELTVTATPTSNYKLGAIYVNGEKLLDGETIITIEDVTEIGATFIVTESELPEYCTPSGSVSPDVYLATITSTGSLTDEVSYTGSELTTPYVLLTDEIEVAAGDSFKVTYKAYSSDNSAIRYTHAETFADWNRDGEFMESDGEYINQIGSCADEDTADAWNNGRQMDSITQTYEVPLDAETGVTIVRVRYTNAWHSTEGAEGGHGACADVEGGMVYDIPVRIVVPTGIESAEAEEPISVYPNPFDTQLIIKSESAGRYALYTISGVEIKSGAIAEGTNIVDTEALMPGTYILRVDNNSVVTTTKVIKVK